MKRNVKHIVCVAVFAALTVICACLIPLSGVNYDLSKYLPEEAITKKGYDIYSQQFGGTDTAGVMVYLSEQKDAAYFTDTFDGIREKHSEVLDSVTLSGTTDDTALYEFVFGAKGTDGRVAAALDDIRRAAGENAAMCGTVIDDGATSGYMAQVSIIAAAILVPVIILLLILSTKSFMSALLVTVTLGVSVVLNMGTNFILGDVSYITQGIALALQLAITLDYSIFMVHEYERQIKEGADRGQAVKQAVKKAFGSVAASALTTLSGFIALLFMRFSIGADIGLVFIKGVALSFLCVALLLPSMLYLFGKAVKRAEHRPLIPRFDKPSKGIFRAKYVFSFLILLLIPAIILQNKIDYRFGVSGMIAGEGVPSYDAKKEITEKYGSQNRVIVVYPDREAAAELQMSSALSELRFDGGEKMFSSVLSSSSAKSMVISGLTDGLKQSQFGTLIPEGFSIAYSDTYEEFLTNAAQAVADVFGMTAEQAAAILQGAVGPQLETVREAYAAIDAEFVSDDGYGRMILTAETEEEGEEAFLMCETLNAELDKNDAFKGYAVLGETPVAFDMMTYMQKDYTLISIISAVLVFLIIMVTFRSLSIPVLLILPIYTCISINSAILAFSASPVPFLGMMVVSMVHLGATIDYAILYASKYCRYRKSMTKKDSFLRSLSESIPSILISAIALTVAGFAISWSTVLPATVQMGRLIGRAGLLSAFFSIFVLPGILYLSDFVIRKTTLKADFMTDGAAARAEDGRTKEENAADDLANVTTETEHTEPQPTQTKEKSAEARQTETEQTQTEREPSDKDRT